MNNIFKSIYYILFIIIMFFVDKYKPSSIEYITFHKIEYLKLERMSKDESIPHMIIYGPEGCGKKTAIKIFLELIYDKSVHNINDAIYNVSSSGNIIKQVVIKQSNYHIIIEPNNNNFDRYIIHDVVKEYAKRASLGVYTTNRAFKIILINNIDNLSTQAQASLRRTMEKFSNTCRFILCGKSLSKILEPLRSRCYCFKLNSPTNNELLKLLIPICEKENMSLSLFQYNNIIKRSKNNIKTALWLLELYKLNEIYLNTSYDEVILTIIEYLLSKKLSNIMIIRNLLYKITITNITGTRIVEDITNLLLVNDNITYENKLKIAELAAECEHKIIKGRRKMLQIERYIIGIIYILSRHTIIKS